MIAETAFASLSVTSDPLLPEALKQIFSNKKILREFNFADFVLMLILMLISFVAPVRTSVKHA